MVIRDSRGLVIASCSKVVHQVLGVCEVEALTAVWALSFAFDVGVKKGCVGGRLNGSHFGFKGGWNGFGTIWVTFGGCKEFVPAF